MFSHHLLAKKLKALCLFMALPFSLLASTSTNAEDILTATPVTYLLASELTAGTGLSTAYLPPKRYGLSRLPNWFSGKGAELTAKAGVDATVVITLGALWPQDSLFITARQGNIKLIEIDASQALSPRAPAIATLRLEDGNQSLMAWLNPNNLSVMTAIISQDLQRVWPKQALLIAENQRQLMQSTRALINAQQDFLLTAGIDSVFLLSDQLEDFAAGNQLFVMGRLTTPNAMWSAEDKQNLQQLVADNPHIWLLTTKNINKSLQQILPDFKQVLQIDSLDRWGKGFKKGQPLQRWMLHD